MPAAIKIAAPSPSTTVEPAAARLVAGTASIGGLFVDVRSGAGGLAPGASSALLAMASRTRTPGWSAGQNVDAGNSLSNTIDRTLNFHVKAGLESSEYETIVELRGIKWPSTLSRDPAVQTHKGLNGCLEIVVVDRVIVGRSLGIWSARDDLSPRSDLDRFSGF